MMLVYISGELIVIMLLSVNMSEWGLSFMAISTAASGTNSYFNTLSPSISSKTSIGKLHTDDSSVA
jgi:hypothetical protein